MREYLEDFMFSHMPWIEQVGYHNLQAMEISSGDYCREILAAKRPFDKLGYMIFARCFYTHVCFIMKDHYWTSHVDDDLSKCTIVLAFIRGKGHFFMDTVHDAFIVGPPEDTVVNKAVQGVIDPLYTGEQQNQEQYRIDPDHEVEIGKKNGSDQPVFPEPLLIQPVV